MDFTKLLNDTKALFSFTNKEDVELAAPVMPADMPVEPTDVPVEDEVKEEDVMASFDARLVALEEGVKNILEIVTALNSEIPLQEEKITNLSKELEVVKEQPTAAPVYFNSESIKEPITAYQKYRADKN